MRLDSPMTIHDANMQRFLSGGAAQCAAGMPMLMVMIFIDRDA